MAATRAEVARLAGVSPSTVTYVLTGQRSTTPATRARVLRAVEELGYLPNTAARSLASRGLRSVGVLFRRQRTTINANDLDYVDGARAALEAQGIQVVLPVLNSGAVARELDTMVRSQSVDGAILMDVVRADLRESLLQEAGLPTVMIGTSGEASGAPSIDADFEQMAVCALEHLRSLGHCRVLGLMRRVGARDANAYHAAIRGLRRSAARLGVEVVTRCEPDSAPVGADLVGREGLVEGCTAVVANNPVAVIGLACATRAYGLRIPEDLSVIALGVTEHRGLAEAAFSECSVDREAMGRAAGELLLRHARGESVARRLLMPSRFIDRGSTAPPA